MDTRITASGAASAPVTSAPATSALATGARASGAPQSWDYAMTFGETWEGDARNNSYASKGGAIMRGGLGDDTYQIADGTEQVIETPDGGVDTIETYLSAYTLPDWVENLTLTGTSWSSGTGNALDNVITGNAQPNILDGGAGDDILIGNGSPHVAGHVIPRGDTFIIRAGEGNDTILDFHPGNDGGDLISLPGFDYRSLAGIMATAREVDGAVLFALSATQTLTVRGEMTTLSGTRDLRISDFTLRDFDFTASFTAPPSLRQDGEGHTVALLTGRAEVNSLVYVKDAGTEMVLGEARADAAGVWHFTTGPLAAGPHDFTATAVEQKLSPDDGLMHYFEVSTSAPSSVLVPATPTGEPPAAPVLLLDAGSDTGAAGNGITADTTPTLHGTAEAGSLVTLYDSDGVTALGSATATDGTWQITTPVLAGGAHSLVAVASDGAGLQSDPSAPLALVINLPREAGAFPSPGFDRDFYLAQNPDVAASGIDALVHYQRFGWHEGRDPDALFDVGYYLNQNPDVAAAGGDPLQHYLKFGWQEGRDPSLAFSTTGYLAENPDAAGNPLLHYLTTGQTEDRPLVAAAPHATGPVGPLMDAAFYFASNPDVAEAGIDPQTHFDRFGWQEGRDPNAWFDVSYYLDHNPDVAAAHVNPAEHYLAHGWREHRDPGTAFSTDAYLAANPDVAAAGVNPLEHYLHFGITENRDLGLG